MASDDLEIVTFRLKHSTIEDLRDWERDEDRSRGNLLRQIVETAVEQRKAQTPKGSKK